MMKVCLQHVFQKEIGVFMEESFLRMTQTMQKKQIFQTSTFLGSF